MIKGALFDLDGTLIDTEPCYANAAQNVINQFGNGNVYDWDVRRRVVGAPELTGARIIVEAYHIKLTPEQYLEERNKHVFAREGFSNCVPMKGAVEITHKLKSKGIKIAVATSSWRMLYDVKINSSKEKKEWFERDINAVVLGDDPRVKQGKPNPDIFIAAANDLGLKPEECIVFEDAVNGVMAAKNANAGIVVAVPDPHFKDDCSKIPDVLVLNSLLEFDFSLLI